MQVASTIVASVWSARKSSSTLPNETVRVTAAQRPCRRPMAAIVARLWIGAALNVGWR